MIQGDLNGARLTASWTVFALLAAMSLLPGTAWISAWLLGVPLIVFSGTPRKWLAAVLAVVDVVCLLISGFGWVAPLFGIGAYFIGWVIGDALRSKESPYMGIVAATLTMIMLELVLLALLRFSGVDIFASLTQMLHSSFQKTQSMVQSSDQQLLNSFADEMVARVRLMLPASIGIMGFLFAALNLVLGRLLFDPKKMPFQPLLSVWQMPYSLTGVYMFSLILVLVGFMRDSSIVWQVINNVSLLSGFFIGIQGLSFIWRRIRTKSLSVLWLVLLLLAALIVPLAGNVYIMLGLVDQLGRYRRKG